MDYQSRGPAKPSNRSSFDVSIMSQVCAWAIKSRSSVALSEMAISPSIRAWRTVIGSAAKP